MNNQEETMNFTEMQNALKDFDDLFISKCKLLGLSLEETQRQLLENDVRNAMLKAMSDIFANRQMSVTIIYRD